MDDTTTNDRPRSERVPFSGDCDGGVRGGESNPSGLFSHYSTQEERPLAAYGVLAGTYLSASGASLLALRRRNRRLPERIGPADVLLIGVASHKMSRLVTKDKVASFLRAPFTRYEESSGQGEVEEEPYGHGLRLAVGELLICPYCMSQWAATGLSLGLVGAPRFTRLLSTVLVASTISDFLQIAYLKAEQSA
jgi:hypothetical protein